ncbi:MAG: hypothetical protein HY904_09295 [Deltaproteobacteria bacterium]|nr:hypothetical protein [Deltaproteobacteria bacterium]
MLAALLITGWLGGQAGAAGDAPRVVAPVLAYGAPEGAARVVAYFPFGGSKELQRDERTGMWRGRALLGAAVPEGSYPVALVVEAQDGSRMVRHEQLQVRADGQPFQARVADEAVAPGGVVELVVDAVEPALAVTARAPTLWTGARPLGPATWGSRTDWGALWVVPADAAAGDHTVEVSVTDRAGRTFSRGLVLRVVRAEAR